MRFSLLAMVTIGALFLSSDENTERRRLTAPTYYIAASAEYEGYPNELRIRGASNLPPGSRLIINAYDLIGQESHLLSEKTIVVLGPDGFFEVKLRAFPDTSFRHNIVCDIVFMIDFNQPLTVRQILGKDGEHLGYPENPQVGIGSGDKRSLSALVHVP